jgi:hypothetical protein
MEIEYKANPEGLWLDLIGVITTLFLGYVSQSEASSKAEVMSCSSLVSTTYDGAQH